MRFALKYPTENRKTGPIGIITASKDTCPLVCPFHNKGCYANSGFMRIHWDRLENGERGVLFPELLIQLKMIPQGNLIRYADAGDLPGEGNEIDYKKLTDLVYICKKNKLHVATYTHKPLTKQNLDIIKEVNKSGAFLINISCEDTKSVNKILKKNLNPVITLPSDYSWEGPIKLEQGNIFQCLAEKNEKITCSNCGKNKLPWCWRSDRTWAVGFIAHGSNKKSIDKALKRSK